MFNINRNSLIFYQTDSIYGSSVFALILALLVHLYSEVSEELKKKSDDFSSRRDEETRLINVFTLK